MAVNEMVGPWANTRQSVSKLQKLLCCGSCNQLVTQPCTLGGCEHFFCRQCIENHVDDHTCPVCGIPSRARDVQTNRQLATAVSLCQQLGRLLSPSSPDSIPHELLQAATKNDISSDNLRGHIVLDQVVPSSDLDNFNGVTPPSLAETVHPISTPEPTVKNTPTVSKRRAKLKGQAKKAFVARSNQSWKIGSETEQQAQCESCTTRRARSRISTNCVGLARKVTFDPQKDGGDTAIEDTGTEKEKNADNTEGAGLVGVNTSEAGDRKGKENTKRACVTKQEIKVPRVPKEKRSKLEARSAALGDVSAPENTVSASENSQQPWPSPMGSQQTETTKISRSRTRAHSEKSNDQPWPSPEQNTTVKNALHSPPSQGPITPKSTPKSAPRSTPRSGQGSKLNSSISSSPSLVKKNAKGETPLHVATIRGDIERVTNLLTEGASSNVKDHAGWTPLHEACNHGHVTIATLLLDHGANVHTPGGPQSDTSLHDAVGNHQLACVKLLVAHGANILQRNLQGHTSLDIADTDVMRAALQQTEVADVPVSAASSTLMEEGDRLLVLLTSSLSREERGRVQKYAQKKHATLLQEFSSTVTHLVTSVNQQSQCPRTMKYLQAVLAGKWVVNLDWIEMCESYGQWVSEEAFEVPGASSSPDSMAASRSRTNYQNQLPGLFSGCHFFFHGNFEYPTPSKKELSSLVKLGGGNILTREPRTDSADLTESTVPYHAAASSLLANCSYFLVRDTKEDCRMRQPCLCDVPATWILDSIAFFSLQEPHN